MTTKITLKYRPEMMTLNDMCVLESPPSHTKVRDLLAKHFVDSGGKYIDDIEAAREAVGNIPKNDIRSLISDLWQQINEHSNGDDPN